MMRGFFTILLVLFLFKINAQDCQKHETTFANCAYVSLSFDNIPDTEQLAALHKEGVQLISFLGGNKYKAQLPRDLSLSQLKAYGVIDLKNQIISNSIDQILNKFNSDLEIEDTAIIEVAIAFQNKLNHFHIYNLLNKYEAKFLEIYSAGNMAIIEIEKSKINRLIEEPAVLFVDLAHEKVKPLNFEARIVHGASYLQSGLKGYQLSGEGVIIGVGDGGELGDHIDLDEFVINEADGTIGSFGQHADHVAGTIAGRGNLDPRHKGIAPNSVIVTDKSNKIISNAEEYFSKYDMSLTNNSYGFPFDSLRSGEYNYTSFNLDRQLRESPQILHVFAAGNFGNMRAVGYPQGFKTVLHGYGSAKNVLTVGSIDDEHTTTNSSRGPVNDGRIKPEIVGLGVNLISCGGKNNYYPNSGTSMACPAVTASVALLYERYEQIYGKAPNGDLAKALVCNTAEDLGNPGPDYTYGFGLINPIKAIRDLDNEQFIIDHIDHGETQTHTIQVPAGLSELKILNYWHDHEAEAYPDKALINNLDLEVITPTGVLYNPWVLNNDPNKVDDPASRKKDNLNNIEQVSIKNPVPGTYRLIVKGKDVPFGNQRYNLTYNFDAFDLELLYPSGGESMLPGETNLITWMNDNEADTDYKLEYSINGGQSWTLISDAIDKKSKNYFWEVPQEFTQNGFIRLSNANQHTQNEVSFSIFKRPQNLEVMPVCEDIMKLKWNPVENASSYLVYMYEDDEMVEIGETNESSIEASQSFILDKVYWFSVAAKFSDDKISERTVAVQGILSQSNPCPHEHDCKIQHLLGIKNGRAYTSSSLTENEQLSIGLKNVGRDDISDFEMFVELNDELVLTEVFTSTLYSGMEINYPLKKGLNFKEAKKYQINSWVSLQDDDYHMNDSLVGLYEFMQLPNEPLPFPYAEDFQGKEEFIIHQTNLGLNDLYKWDYENLGSNQNAIKLMKSTENRYLRILNQEDINSSALVTVNLADLSPNEEVLFGFKYLLSNMGDNKGLVFIRGNDEDEWIQVSDLDYSISWRTYEEINMLKILNQHNQQYSTSTQIKFELINVGTFNIDDVNFELKQTEIRTTDPPIESVLKVYPNPFREDLNIDITSEIEDQANFRLYDTGGKMIFETSEVLIIGLNEFNYQLNDLMTSGIYFLSIATNKETTMKKITKM